MHVALLIEHATRMRYIVMSFLAPLAQLYFWTVSHKRHDLKRLLNTKCVFSFSLKRLSETFIILTRIKRDIVTNVKTSPCKVPLLLSDFNYLCIFSTAFRTMLKHLVS